MVAGRFAKSMSMNPRHTWGRAPLVGCHLMARPKRQLVSLSCPQFDYEFNEGYRKSKPFSDRARTAFVVIRIAPVWLGPLAAKNVQLVTEREVL